MEYQATSTFITKDNYEASTMSIPLNPVTFTLLFSCISDSLSTPMPLDSTETQEKFIVIDLFYQMALLLQHQWDSKAWKKPHQPLQNFIAYSACAKVHVSIQQQELQGNTAGVAKLPLLFPFQVTQTLDLCRSSPERLTSVSMNGAVKENTKSNWQTHDHACKSDLWQEKGLA